MFWFLLKVLFLYTPGVLFTFLAVREFIGYLYLKPFKRQVKRLKGKLVILDGFSFTFLSEALWKLFTSGDIMIPEKKRLEGREINEIDIYVQKQFHTVHPWVCLASERAHIEFFKKEHEYTGKLNPLNFDLYGLFFENGATMVKSRAMFANIFNFDNIKKMVPDFQKIIRN